MGDWIPEDLFGQTYGDWKILKAVGFCVKPSLFQTKEGVEGHSMNLLDRFRCPKSQVPLPSPALAVATCPQVQELCCKRWKKMQRFLTSPKRKVKYASRLHQVHLFGGFSRTTWEGPGRVFFMFVNFEKNEIPLDRWKHTKRKNKSVGCAKTCGFSHSQRVQATAGCLVRWRHGPNLHRGIPELWNPRLRGKERVLKGWKYWLVVSWLVTFYLLFIVFYSFSFPRLGDDVFPI